MEDRNGFLSNLYYSTATAALSPVIISSLLWRTFRGTDSLSESLQKIGIPSVARPAGKLIWFHARSLGGASITLPLIKTCLADYENITILLTTTCIETQHALLAEELPAQVILQHFPFDLSWSVQHMVAHWKPQMAIFMECDLWPNLISCLAAHDCQLVLLNARLESTAFFDLYTNGTAKNLFRQMLDKFSLIIPESEMDVAYFQLLGAKMHQIPGWCADLKYAVGMGVCAWDIQKQDPAILCCLKQQIGHMSSWMAVKIHAEECEKLIEVHKSVHSKLDANLVSFFSFINEEAMQHCIHLLEGSGIEWEIWTSHPTENDSVDIFLIDGTKITYLPSFYAAVETVFVAGSLLENMRGHNLAEVAISGSAVITGKHLENFSSMAEQLNYCAVLAAEEVEAIVTATSFGRISEESVERDEEHENDDDNEEQNELEQDIAQEQDRPSNALYRHLQSRTPYSPLSFITEVLTSSSHRPMTAPPVFLPIANSFSRMIGEGGIGHIRRRNHTSPSIYQMDHSIYSPVILDVQEAELYIEPRSASTQFTHQERVAGNLSRASCPEDHGPQQQRQRQQQPQQESFLSSRAFDFQIMNIEDERNEENYQRVEYHRSYTSLEAFLARPSPSPKISEEEEEDYSSQWDPFLEAEESSPTPYHDLKVLGYSGDYVLPATHLPFGSTGPAVWMVNDHVELTDALCCLLLDPLQRKSRGQAAAQGAARLAVGLVLEVWDALKECLLDKVFSSRS